MAPTPNVVVPAALATAPGAGRGGRAAAVRRPGAGRDGGEAGVDAHGKDGGAAFDRSPPVTLSVDAHRLAIGLSRAGEPIDCLARSFPHLVNDIARRWSDPASVVHAIDALLVDRRGGRRGYPADALAELLAVRRSALKRSARKA